MPNKSETTKSGNLIVDQHGIPIGITYKEEDSILMTAVHAARQEQKSGFDGWIFLDKAHDRTIKKLAKRGLLEIKDNMFRPTEAGFHKIEKQGHA